MPTTIKPAGGGNFLTIQDAEDVASDNTAIECYSGGDLGGLTLNNANMSGVVISAAAGHQHNGTDAGNAGVTRMSTAWSLQRSSTVRGIRATAGMSTLATANRVFEISSCLFANASAAGVAFFTVNGAVTMELLFADNVIYGKGTFASLGVVTPLVTNNTGSGTATLNATVRNNTLANSNSHGYGITPRVTASVSSTAVLNLTAEDNVIIGFATADFAEMFLDFGGTETINWTASNNASGDGTADDFGGSGHLVDQVAGDWFVDPETDLRLNQSAPGRNIASDGRNIGFHQGRGLARPDDIAQHIVNDLSTPLTPTAR